MAVSLKHSFQSAKADGLDTSLVRPSDWNAEHTLSLATSRLLGRTTAGTGAAEEISVGAGLTLSSGSLAANTAQVDIFSSSGTYTKPSWATTVEVICIGGGGGGGSGRKGANGAARCGGGGGHGGVYSSECFQASAVGATETITVGAGGTGGASQATNSTDGNNGTAGGNTSFGTKLYAQGGPGGGGGTATSGAAGATVFGMYGRAGAPGSSTTTSGGPPSTGQNPVFLNANNGGAGGPVTSANAAVNGGQGWNTSSSTAPPWKTGTYTAPAASVVTGAGNSGTDNANTVWLGGESGDGGAASTSGNASAGGNGGKWGGAGGGGGASVDSVGNSGAGGNGADGICVVISRA